MGKYIGKVRIGGDTAPIGSTLYAVCETAAATQIKTIIFPEFTNLIDGITIHIRFVYGNSFQGSPIQLTVYDAVGILGNELISPVNIIGNTSWDADEVVSLTYDGNVFRVNNSMAYNKYVTQAELTQAIREVENTISGADAMIFKGALGSGNNQLSSLPTYDYRKGWTYKVAEASLTGYGLGTPVSAGDMIIAIEDGPTTSQQSVNANHWTKIEGSGGNYVTGPSSSIDAHVAVFDGTSGQIIKDSGFTLGKSVPSNALFTDTDTTYTFKDDYNENSNPGATVATINKMKLHYYTCNSASNETMKVINDTDYELIDGKLIILNFINDNNINNPTLKIGNADAKPLVANEIKKDINYLIQYEANEGLNNNGQYEILTALSADYDELLAELQSAIEELDLNFDTEEDLNPNQVLTAFTKDDNTGDITITYANLTDIKVGDAAHADTADAIANPIEILGHQLLGTENNSENAITNDLVFSGNTIKDSLSNGENGIIQCTIDNNNLASFIFIQRSANNTLTYSLLNNGETGDYEILTSNSEINLTDNILSGVLPVDKGGTGNNEWQANWLIYVDEDNNSGIQTLKNINHYVDNGKLIVNADEDKLIKYDNFNFIVDGTTQLIGNTNIAGLITIDSINNNINIADIMEIDSSANSIDITINNFSINKDILQIATESNSTEITINSNSFSINNQLTIANNEINSSIPFSVGIANNQPSPSTTLYGDLEVYGETNLNNKLNIKDEIDFYAISLNGLEQPAAKITTNYHTGTKVNDISDDQGILIFEPATDETGEFGTINKRWKTLYLSDEIIFSQTIINNEEHNTIIKGSQDGINITPKLQVNPDNNSNWNYTFFVNGTSYLNNTITAASINPLADNVKELGNLDTRWKNLFLSNQVIIGNENDNVSLLISESIPKIKFIRTKNNKTSDWYIYNNDDHQLIIEDANTENQNQIIGYRDSITNPEINGFIVKPRLFVNSDSIENYTLLVNGKSKFKDKVGIGLDADNNAYLTIQNFFKLRYESSNNNGQDIIYFDTDNFSIGRIYPSSSEIGFLGLDEHRWNSAYLSNSINITNQNKNNDQAIINMMLSSQQETTSSGAELELKCSANNTILNNIKLDIQKKQHSRLIINATRLENSDTPQASLTLESYNPIIYLNHKIKNGQIIETRSWIIKNDESIFKLSSGDDSASFYGYCKYAGDEQQENTYLCGFQLGPKLYINTDLSSENDTTSLYVKGDTEIQGHLYPVGDAQYDIGNDTTRWQTAYLKKAFIGGTIQGISEGLNLNTNAGTTRTYIAANGLTIRQDNKEGDIAFSKYFIKLLLEKVGTNEQLYSTLTLGCATQPNNNNIGLAGISSKGRIILYNNNNKYTEIVTKVESNNTFIIPAYSGDMYAAHVGNENAIGSCITTDNNGSTEVNQYTGVYVSGHGRITALSYPQNTIIFSEDSSCLRKSQHYITDTVIGVNAKQTADQDTNNYSLYQLFVSGAVKIRAKAASTSTSPANGLFVISCLDPDNKTSQSENIISFNADSSPITSTEKYTSKNVGLIRFSVPYTNTAQNKSGKGQFKFTTYSRTLASDKSEYKAETYQLPECNDALAEDTTYNIFTGKGLTANRLVFTNSNPVTLSSDGHYASSTNIAICSTSKPTENFYVNGTTKLGGNTTITGTTLLQEAVTINKQVNIKGTLILEKTQDASGTNTNANTMPALIVGGTFTQTHVEIDNNGIIAKGATSNNTVAPANLALNNFGGGITMCKSTNSSTHSDSNDYVYIRSDLGNDTDDIPAGNTNNYAYGALVVRGSIGVLKQIRSRQAIFSGTSITAGTQFIALDSPGLTIKPSNSSSSLIQFTSNGGTTTISSSGHYIYTTPSDINTHGDIYLRLIRFRKYCTTAGNANTVNLNDSRSIALDSQFVFRQRSRTSGTQTITATKYFECYLLPATSPGLTDDIEYKILTSKETVTVAQGGTGKTSFTANGLLYADTATSITTHPYILYSSSTNAKALSIKSNNIDIVAGTSTTRYCNIYFKDSKDVNFGYIRARHYASSNGYVDLMLGVNNCQESAGAMYSDPAYMIIRRTRAGTTYCMLDSQFTANPESTSTAGSAGAFRISSGGMSVKYNVLVGGNIYCNGDIHGKNVYGAVWNDYAECRATKTEEPGYCVTETSDGIMMKTTQRLEAGCKITSDTYGVCIGKTEKAKTPIAVTGRVLVYPYRARQEYSLGAAVCSAPDGTVDIMTRDEIMMYPERIVGTVSEIPTYDVWHGGSKENPTDIKVDGRIWIYVR